MKVVQFPIHVFEEIDLIFKMFENLLHGALGLSAHPFFFIGTADVQDLEIPRIKKNKEELEISQIVLSDSAEKKGAKVNNMGR